MNVGEIWVASGKGLTGKPRPVLVLQSSDISSVETIVVSLFSTFQDSKSGLRYLVQANDANGLKEDSYVMVDKLYAIPRTNFMKKQGELTPQQVYEVEKLLLKLIDFDKIEQGVTEI
ncbi:putative endoribonuclease MazF [Actinomycetota bacterium]|nr:putative endoribonuclease MazF [Actinomycetota bacterium]